MKISTKVSLAIVTAILGVLGIATALRLSEERSMLLEETRRDNLFLGQTLRAIFLNTDKTTTAGLVHAMIHGTDAPERGGLRIVTTTGNATPGRRPRAPLETLTDLRANREVVVLTPNTALTYVPLTPGDSEVLEVSEPLGSVATFLQRSLRNSMVAALVLAIIGIGATTLLVRWLVQRPMDALTAGARRIASGELTARVPVERNDEIGDFARDMNVMAERLDDARSKLAEESAARVSTLEALRHADRLRTVGQLASALAHELGTPLNVVVGRARMIQQAPEVTADASDNARIIVEQAARMTKLIRQLLGFARSKGPERRPEDVRAIARETVEMLGPIAKRTNVQLALVVAQNECVAEVDRNQVLQAVTNLVMNGIQAMPRGGTLSLAVDKTTCTPPSATLLPEGEYIRVSVVDRGVGIREEHRDQLFEPFFTTKERGEGTGLGLPVTFGIVREHGGWIDVESELGKGSTFRISLPVHARDTTGRHASLNEP